jgi:DNA-damage-inducible protein D
MSTHNKKLFSAAKEAGVKHYGTFQDFGYAGLYGGLGQKEIHFKKKLKDNQKILDHMGSEELAANLFRTTQTEAKLKREGIQGEGKANNAHYKVGQTIRETIKNLGGTMPERLPIKDSIKEAKKRIKVSQKLLLLKKRRETK